MPENFRIAIMGAGGQGGYLGGLLSLAGEDITLIARGKHLKTIQSKGLTLKSNTGEITSLQVKITDDPAEIGIVDLLIFCVKAYDLDSAAEQSKPLVGPDTVVLPVQNGIGIPERLGEVFGKKAVIGGVSYLLGKIEKPGVITYGGISGKLYFGELSGGKSTRTEKILNVFLQVGIEAKLHTSIRKAIWEKFILICATGGVMSLLRLPVGLVLDCPESSALFKSVMDEAELVARASYANLPDGLADRLFNFVKTSVEPTMKSSQLEDLLAGRRLELEYLNGTVVRLGKKNGIPTPFNFAVYAALKPYIEGTPKE